MRVGLDGITGEVGHLGERSVELSHWHSLNKFWQVDRGRLVNGWLPDDGTLGVTNNYRSLQMYGPAVQDAHKVAPVEVEGARFVHHTGGNIGWRTVYAILPDTRSGICVLINSSLGNDLWMQLLKVWAEQQ